MKQLLVDQKTKNKKDASNVLGPHDFNTTSYINQDVENANK